MYAKEFTDSIVLDSIATTSYSYMKKMADIYIYCQHKIITGVLADVFHPSKFNKKLHSEKLRVAAFQF